MSLMKFCCSRFNPFGNNLIFATLGTTENSCHCFYLGTRERESSTAGADTHWELRLTGLMGCSKICIVCILR